MSSFSIYPIIRKDDWKKNSTRISKSRINDLEKLYMTIYKSFVQFILFLPLISPSLDWQLYYACTIEITRYYILSVSDKLWGGRGKKGDPLPAKKTRDGHGNRNHRSSTTECAEPRIWLWPNSLRLRAWMVAAECTSSRRKPDIPEALWWR